MNAVISCPIDTYSGYGARARDFVEALIMTKPDWQVQILAQRWGNCREGYLEDHKKYDLMSRIIPQLTKQPDVWFQITVPNEFQKVGKYNIGVTAGIETTLCHVDWIKGCNNMDLVLVSSNHAKKVFEQSKYEMMDNRTQQVMDRIELKTPIEVLFEGVDLGKYFKEPTTSFNISSIPESFCFLVVGHWMQGDFGEDRKNIGYTIKTFLETFKNKPKPPALILKTQQVGTSLMDREALLDKIQAIRASVRGTLPNIYLIHGEISDDEMNALYNHPKVKVMVSLTKGEGYGRPLAEFSVTGKPIIVSGWSGQMDFLDPNFNLVVGGTLTNVHPSAVMQNMLLAEAQWFTPNDENVATAYKNVFKSYIDYVGLSKKQGKRTSNEFSFLKMAELLERILSERVPVFASQVELKLPELPTIEKIN